MRMVLHRSVIIGFKMIVYRCTSLLLSFILVVLLPPSIESMRVVLLGQL